MKRLTCCVLALLLCLLCACSAGQQTNTVDIYYRVADGGLAEGCAIARYSAPVSAAGDRLHETLRLLAAPPADAVGLQSPLSGGVAISSYSLDGRCLKLALSRGYTSMHPAEQTICRSCLLLTLCGLDEVSSISIYEEDTLVEADLSRAVLLTDSLPEGCGVMSLHLWLPQADSEFLTAKPVELDLTTCPSAAEGALELLLAEPAIAACLDRAPVLERVTVDKGICTVDLGDEFRDACPRSASAERLFLYAIVNTLTELDGVNKVQFLSGGQRLESLLYIDLSGEFRREPAFLDTEAAAAENRVVTLYLGTAAGRLAPVTAALPVSVEQEDAIRQTVLFLLELKDSWGYRRLLPASTVLRDYALEDGVCTLYLTDDFHRSIDGEELAAAALAATLAAACGVTAIRIHTESGSYHHGMLVEKDGAWIVDGT